MLLTQKPQERRRILRRKRKRIPYFGGRGTGRDHCRSQARSRESPVLNDPSETMGVRVDIASRTRAGEGRVVLDQG